MSDVPDALKPSVFTMRIPDGDDVVWFNSVTGATLRLAPDRSAFLERYLEQATAATSRLEPAAVPSPGSAPSPDPLLVGLYRQGFLVPRSTDEAAAAHQRYLSDRDDPGLLMLTIAPTFGCNAHCSYCFQQDLPHLRPMDDDTRKALVAFVQARSEGLRSMGVQWFGGEPLLALDVLTRCTHQFQDICSAAGAAYHAELLTNGLLLQHRDLWRRLPDLGITEVQVPVDGLPTTYAQRKGIPQRRAESFYRFLVSQAEEIAAGTGRLVIKINVDRENLSEAYRVVDLFADAGVADARVHLRLAILGTDTDIVDCIPHDCLTVAEFHDEETAFYSYLRTRGLAPPAMPRQLRWPCAATLRNYYTIDPAGRLGTCAPLTGVTVPEHQTLGTSLQSPPPPPAFNHHDPFRSPGCRTCALLPACLGSCPRRATGHAAPAGGTTSSGRANRASPAGTGSLALPRAGECRVAARLVRRILAAVPA